MKQFQHWVSAVEGRKLLSAAAAMLVAGAFIVTSLVVAPEPATTEVELSSGVSSGPSSDTLSVASTIPLAGEGGPQPTANGGVVAGPSGQGSGTTLPTAAGSVERMASDRGVTPEEIKLGLVYANSALSSAGFSFGDRGDIPAYAQALATYANEHGGAAGRKIRIVDRPTDPTSTTDQAAACRAMVDDLKVFGVLDLALSNGPAQTCISQQGRTPYVHSSPWSADFQALSGGFDVANGPSIDRIARALVRDLTAAGWLKPDSVVGVFGDSCPTTEATVRDLLVPLLKKVVSRVEVGLHDCTIDATLRQPGGIATRFRTANVDRVISVTNYISMQIFLQTAGGLGGWKPMYARSDWFTGVQDATSKNFDPAQYDGTIGITSGRRPLLNAGKPAYPGMDRCNDAAKAAGIAPVDGPDAELDALLCDQFFLMIDGLNAAGPNPTRTSWAAGVQSLGRRDFANWGPSSFSRGKTNGADQVYTAIWTGGCKCWKATSEPRSLD